MNCSFLYLNSLNGFLTGAEYEINCAYIRSFLKSRGISSKQIIYRRESSIFTLEHLVDFVCSEAVCSALVVYVNEYNYYSTKIVLRLIKERNFHPVILIGPSAADVGMNLYENFPADCYVMSDAAYALWDMLISEKFPVRYCSEQKISLEQMPHPYSNEILPPREVFNVGLYSSVGCYGKCVFCSYAKDDILQCHSVESIKRELEYLYEKIGRMEGRISFLDDCFSISEKRIVEICGIIAELNLPYEFWCTTRADVLSDEAMRSLKSARFSVSVGMETFSSCLLSQIGKLCNHSSNEYISLLSHQNYYAKTIGLSYYLTVMFGLPGETKEDIAMTLSFLEENSITKVSFNFMTLFYNSRLREVYEKENIVVRDVTNYGFRTYYTNSTVRFVQGLTWKNKFIKNQLIFTSRAVQKRKKFLEYVTGITSNVPEHVSCSEENISFHLSEDIPYDDLKKKVSVTTNYFIYCNGLTKTGRLYMDDRKHLKMEIPEYDSVVKNFNQNDIYCENLFFLWEDGGRLKCKCGNVFEKKLFSVPAITAESEGIESYVLAHYEYFMSKTEFTQEELTAFCFRGAYQFTKNIKKEYAFPLVMEKCERLSDVFEVANFIVKNESSLGEKISIFCSKTKPEFYSKHPFLSYFFIICSDYVGFLYCPGKRASVILDIKENAGMRKVLDMQTDLQNYPVLYRKCRHFVELMVVDE